VRTRQFKEAEQYTVRALRQYAGEKRKLEAQRKAEAYNSKIRAILATEETTTFGLKFHWTEDELRDYADLRLQLDETVGLDVVKEWIVQRLYDGAERAVCNDPIDRRHIVVAGGFGVGKRTASLLLMQAVQLLWKMARPTAPAAKKGAGSFVGAAGRPQLGDKVMLTADYASYDDAKHGPLTPGDIGDVTHDPPPGHGVLVEFNGETWWYSERALQKVVPAPVCKPNNPSPSVRKLEDFGTVLVPQQGSSVFAGVDLDELEKGTIFYVRLGDGQNSPQEMVDGHILRALQDKDSVVIITGDSTYVDKFLVVEQMLRVEPFRIPLPNISVPVLAKITLNLLETSQHELALSKASAATVPEAVPKDATLRALKHVVKQVYGGRALIQQGGYLAQEMLQASLPLGFFAVASLTLSLRSPVRPLCLAESHQSQE
jgi:hypothetical protein